jgi:phenylalanyl-tRNA synthetase alpha chain
MLHIPDIAPLLVELHSITDLNVLHTFHSTYLGKHWSINALFKTLKDATPEEKKTAWSRIQHIFKELESAFFAHQAQLQRQVRHDNLAADPIDWSIPWIPLSLWALNLQNLLRRRVEDVFRGMWFHVSYGHELVTMYQNFTAVNIPPTHPATEMHDTFYVSSGNTWGDSWDGSRVWGGVWGSVWGGVWRIPSPASWLVLRTHTSAAQHDLIRTHGVPCRFVVPGKVFRYENMDATHDCVFWQVEWVVIDKTISIAHLKGMMKDILEAILEQPVEMRIRPAYFPFVEPWFEIDALCVMWGKKRWMEILWAGMIHPNVLSEAWVDHSQRSGFAFGLWLSRLVAVKYGIHDIRLLTNGDLRFHETVWRHPLG